jgi:hypothetical protein
VERGESAKKEDEDDGGEFPVIGVPEGDFGDLLVLSRGVFLEEECLGLVAPELLDSVLASDPRLDFFFFVEVELASLLELRGAGVRGSSDATDRVAGGGDRGFLNTESDEGFGGKLSARDLFCCAEGPCCSIGGRGASVSGSGGSTVDTSDQYGSSSDGLSMLSNAGGGPAKGFRLESSALRRDTSLEAQNTIRMLVYGYENRMQR